MVTSTGAIITSWGHLKMRLTPESALLVGTQVHTAPKAFGKAMSAVKPRKAVAYHFFKGFDTTAAIEFEYPGDE